MEPRGWQVVLHLHADRSATARIQVNGRLLLPGCDGLPAEQTLQYIAGALVDFRAGDQLALRAQGSVGTIRTIRLGDALLAQLWLRERVAELTQALEPEASAEDSGARSGVRAALKPGEVEAQAATSKKSAP
jgi:hypothetical protein